MGKAELSLNHAEAAIAPLRKAISIDPQSAEAHFVLGTALKRTRDAAGGTREQTISLALQNKEPVTANSVSQ